ncbi:MAG: hypothetical protein CL486_05840 [Acidobacteria bacterium]|nr:hypothetical protein [Acidobacteriota bacterium]
MPNAEAAKVASAMRHWSSWAKFSVWLPVSGHMKLSQEGETLTLLKDAQCLEPGCGITLLVFILDV